MSNSGAIQRSVPPLCEPREVVVESASWAKPKSERWTERLASMSTFAWIKDELV